ncbi:uncharacterized protein BP5553_05288 [Venustampulla echinocandica]|uniref:rRNA methyltransferase 1, mitochondrial n=1 Tax=Venustampulla echinocandica TaxID=2656787 RepID=A0A370TQP1_9HELO|nr:uncharacterized protein BP5553_05288 [Venustampulla echinocandica]RDL37855.1 hypothetical protein BP5553_05288 [Venustampulla echinocandica]
MSSIILLRNVRYMRAVLPASRLSYHSGKAASVNTAIARGLRKSKGLAFRGSSTREPKANDPREKFIERNGLVRRSADPPQFSGPQVTRDGWEGRPKKEAAGGRTPQEPQARIYRGIKLIKTNEQLARKKPDPAGPAGSGRHGHKQERRRTPFDEEEKGYSGPRRQFDRSAEPFKAPGRGADRGSFGAREKSDYSSKYPPSTARSSPNKQRYGERDFGERRGDRGSFNAREKSDYPPKYPSSSTPYQQRDGERGSMERRDERGGYQAHAKSDYSSKYPSSSTRSAPYERRDRERDSGERRADRGSFKPREKSDYSSRYPSSSTRSSPYQQRDRERGSIERRGDRGGYEAREKSDYSAKYPSSSRSSSYQSRIEERGSVEPRGDQRSRGEIAALAKALADPPTRSAAVETRWNDPEERNNRGPTTRSSGPDSRTPLSVPYTTPASEFLYGTSVVEAALKAQKGRGRRRQLYKFYIYEGENRENTERDDDLERLARQCKVKIQRIRGDWLRLMDKMSGGRPHNGYILEASPLPRLPVLSLGSTAVEYDGYGIKVELDHQSREDAAINGTSDFIHMPVDRVGRKPMVLLLDGIQDPGNLGGIIRTASFLGASAVAISTRKTASFTPVVLKASAGASENITLFSVQRPDSFIHKSKLAGWKIYAAVAPTEKGTPRSRNSVAANNIGNPLADDPCILMLGSEGEGLHTKLRRSADVEVYIPSCGRSLSVDSLNVSVATGILCNSFLTRSYPKKGAAAEPLAEQEGGEVAEQEQRASSEPASDLF